MQHYPDVTVTMRHENGLPAQVLADLSAGSDLLVIGSHGHRAASALLLGRVARDVLKRAECAVAVVRGQLHRDALGQGHVIAGESP